ncbi:MAG: MurT ligase domain-containing protein [Gaiellales bacterium]
MLFTAKVAAARAAASLSRMTGSGGGTTLPGRLLLAMDDGAIGRLAERLELGSVVVSATNGKTTTAKMLAGLVEPELPVCHNRAGANLASGVASALLASPSRALGVFEVDEAALAGVVRDLRPSVLVLGNLFRDQLDRYGELEMVGERWAAVTSGLDGDRVLVRNGDDPLVASLPPGSARTISFGIADSSAALAEMPHAADSKWCARCGTRLAYVAVFLGHLGAWQCPNCGLRRPELEVSAAEIRMHGLESCTFSLKTPIGDAEVRLPIPGLYNVYNALAAAAAACALGRVPLERIVSGLERFDPAFGRFEELVVDGRPVVLLLVKNPAGANEVIRTLAGDAAPKQLVVALNDRIADGRDVSWIWDVDWEPLAAGAARAMTTGTRAAEMALRLSYAGLPPERLDVVGDSGRALDQAVSAGDGPVYVLATYTAMLELRSLLVDRGAARPYWEVAPA